MSIKALFIPLFDIKVSEMDGLYSASDFAAKWYY